MEMIRDNAPETGPKYPHLEQLFRRAIEDGTLTPGDKLPPLRQASWEAGCSLGTMARVYSALERQGLVTSEVGRGTFVKEPDSLTANVILPPGSGGSADLSMINLVQNEIHHSQAENLVRQAMARAAEKLPSVMITGYGDGSGHHEMKPRLMPLLDPSLQDLNPGDLILTHGVQHALYTILSRMAGKGDGVAVEPLSYPGIRAIIAQHGLTCHSVETDEDGILPDSLDMVCRDGRVRLLLTSPTGQNPTGITTSLERRQAICEVARRRDLLIVEDDIYGHLYPESPPPYAALLPEQSIYLTGLSKRVAPALRVGLALVPTRQNLLMAQTITTQCWMVSPLLAAAAADIAERDDQLSKMADDCIARSKARAATLSKRLGGLVQGIEACRPHAWITLPEGVTDEMLEPIAKSHGVLITEGYRFSNRIIADHGHIRVALLSCPTDRQFELGIERLALALEQIRQQAEPAPDMSFV
ncbi:DNA-binding transcriptional MocR family regulator [Aestuariispira insulae]|uniref:DNA-binding transcriptional MocR family regulator n=2 Tax=Aestuariispira insulae TaxID=1461337 RepID=A0A3D9HWY9_9PROT|nr:DNA-binding transcriptional MocR family regulator [Aestuariispira insulae]